MKPLKHSINQYRNINGVRLVCWCWIQSDFAQLIEKCKERKVAYRIIENQMYVDETKTNQL